MMLHYRSLSSQLDYRHSLRRVGRVTKKLMTFLHVTCFVDDVHVFAAADIVVVVSSSWILPCFRPSPDCWDVMMMKMRVQHYCRFHVC